MSKIEVNEITQQTGTTLTVGGGACKTATVDATTITLGNNTGTSTISLNTGAAFGGGIDAVLWETTPQTGSFQATKGKGYFMNTTSGALTLTTPASPSAGDIFAVADYARTFATNNLTISPHASAKIGGQAASATLDVNGQASTFVYVDSTQGWINVQNAEDTETGTSFIEATGGTITTVCTNFKVHTFTGPGTFCVSNAGSPQGSNEISYLVVAGGGGGSANGGGGGGAGGYREGKSPQTPYTSSPLACTSGSNNGLPVAVASYPVQVGGGGAGVSSGRSCNGSNSVFAGTTTITSTGGGGSGTFCGSASPTAAAVIGANGGSGGGGSGGTSVPSIPSIPSANKGSGNTPPVSPSQGNDGGRGMHSGSYTPTGAVGGGGGGGAGGTGGEPVLNPGTGGTGGVGTPTQITGSAVSYAGGGGGGIGPGTGFTTPAGSPCGTGGAGGKHPGTDAVAGTDNRGGGGGGGGHQPQAGQNGGSGVVIIRYKFQ